MTECPQCGGDGEIESFRGYTLCQLCRGAGQVSEETAEQYQEKQEEDRAAQQINKIETHP